MAPESEMMVYYWVFTQQLYHFIHYIKDPNLERLPVPNHSKQSAHLYKCNAAHKVAFDGQCARHIALWAGGLFNKSAPGHLLTHSANYTKDKYESNACLHEILTFLIFCTASYWYE